MKASAVDVKVWGDSVRSGPLSLSNNSKFPLPEIKQNKLTLFSKL